MKKTRIMKYAYFLFGILSIASLSVGVASWSVSKKEEENIELKTDADSNAIGSGLLSIDTTYGTNGFFLTHLNSYGFDPPYDENSLKEYSISDAGCLIVYLLLDPSVSPSDTIKIETQIKGTTTTYKDVFDDNSVKAISGYFNGNSVTVTTDSSFTSQGYYGGFFTLNGIYSLRDKVSLSLTYDIDFSSKRGIRDWSKPNSYYESLSGGDLVIDFRAELL